MGEPLLSGQSASNWTEIKRFYCFVTFGASSVSTVQTHGVA